MRKYIQCVIATFLLMCSASEISAQYQNTTIYTPKNTSVTAMHFIGTDYTSTQKNDAKNYWLSVYNNRITYQGEATHKYNCHAYAWHVSEGGSQVWINTPEQKKYWNDNSYTEVSNPATATKVSFGGPCYYWDASQNRYVDNCDHSAVTTSTANYFISKWGPSPLFKHHKNDCPYSIEDLHYYVPPPPPAISGPTLICPGSTTYTFTTTNWQAWYSWNKSYNLEIATVNANTITVYGTNYYGEGSSGWVNILQLNGAEVAKHNLWVGAPEIQIYGPSSIGQSGEAQFYCESTSDLVNAYQLYYEWAVYPDIGFYGYGYGPQVSIQFPSYYSNYTVSVRASNDCGWGDYVSHDVYMSPSPAPSSVYPNPASDIVSIEIDAQAQSSAPAITSGTQLKLDKTYDLRLYDSQGNILRNAKTKGGSVQFNVSALPNGIYYLHIYDGVNPKPEIQQIVVEH